MVCVREKQQETRQGGSDLNISHEIGEEDGEVFG
jgi:hypothetical protein